MLTDLLNRHFLKSFETLPKDSGEFSGQVLLQDSGKNGFSIPSLPNLFISNSASEAWQISRMVVVQETAKMARIQIGGMFEQPFGRLN